jgi:TrmH family RNA methyltransferase
MVVKSEIKHIKRLQQKKYRIQNRCFVAEGIKTVSELLQSPVKAKKVYTTDPSLVPGTAVETVIVSEAELKSMSGLRSPNKMLGVFAIPDSKPPGHKDWILVADSIQDPGNLGTIIRLCDWFEIRHLVCSEDTVDCYNPKTLQATMGSVARVNIIYTALKKWLPLVKQPVYGAFLDGHSIYEEELAVPGVLVVGNESHGISADVADAVTRRIAIPQFGSKSAESLNVATATAILLHEIRRPIQK